MKPFLKIMFTLLLLLFFSCGSNRNRIVQKKDDKAYIQEETKEIVESNITETSSGVVDLQQLFQNKGLKITSTGTDYEFKYGDFTFKGNANVELTDQKAETKLHHKYKIHNIYRIKTIFRKNNIYRIHNIYRTTNTEREATPWYIFVLLGVFLKLLLGLLWSWIKKQINY